MTGAELREIRKALYGEGDEATASFARALGLGSSISAQASLAASVRRLEAMWRVPEWFAKLAVIYLEATTDHKLDQRIKHALRKLNNRDKSPAAQAPSAAIPDSQ